MFKSKILPLSKFSFELKETMFDYTIAFKMFSPPLRFQDRHRRDAGRGLLQPPLLDLSLVPLIEVSLEN